MRIEFRKIPLTLSEFQLTHEGLLCDGAFEKKSNKIVLLDIKLTGKTPVCCDICDAEFDLRVNDKISLKVYDGISESEDLDIVECQDHFVDFDEIVAGEISSIKSDYYYCDKCKNIEGE